MFGQLSNYQSRSFWQQNPEVRFDTLYESHTYRIFSFSRVALGVSRDQFEYFGYSDLRNKSVFDDFVSRAKAGAMYDTGLTPKYGDEILMLSTCGFSDTERMVVFAFREK